MAIELTILTLNVWGIPFVSSDRNIRIEAIADELAKRSYDIVSLQEVWSENDYQIIKNKTAHVYDYSHYFYSGVFGSGLCLLSKYPISSALFHVWSVNGYVHRIQHADWFGGKGVGLCRILVNNKPVNVYVAHLHAEYDEKNDEYKAHRVIQAYDTAQFIESTRGDAILQILAGDLNTEPNDIAYKILTKSSKLIDCCNDCDNIGTNECERNSYTSSKAASKNPIGKRIDHILIRPGDNYEVKNCKYNLPFAERIPGHSISYSDHEAVSIDLEIEEKNMKIREETKAEGNTISVSHNTDTCHVEEKSMNSEIYEAFNALQACISVCNDKLEKLKTDRIIYLSLALFTILLLVALTEMSPPYGFYIVFLVIKFLLIAFILYTLFMATLWNFIERHGVLSGKLSMEIALKNPEKSL